MVPYRKRQRVDNILARTTVESITLTQWFKLNRRDPCAHSLLYVEIPTKYTLIAKEVDWSPRKQGFSLGRMAYIHPGSGDTFYLRHLLTKVRGAQSFKDLRTANGIVCRNFQAACKKMGLLADDDEWLLVMGEVGQWGMAKLVRYLFVSMLLFCELANPKKLFDQTWELLSEDIAYKCQKEARLNGVSISPDLFKRITVARAAATTTELFIFPLPLQPSRSNIRVSPL
ncbi:unnamed protein product [Linum trigynum]|uniref:Uncharacterized protein n=1 Tax=Linum trigynum TaxID=586398 RepID=A0AAV2FBB4_9ROSI